MWRRVLALVALKNGRVVVLSIAQIKKESPAFHRENYGYIDEIAVKAEYRRQGIGTEMLKEILEWFKSRDIDIIQLDVAAANSMGCSFWEKHGFQTGGHRMYLKR